MKIHSFLITIAILSISWSSGMQVTGTFTDSRDGKAYKTVRIGTQTWMAENLAYNASSGCFVYDNIRSNVTIYGYLYNWETANKVAPTGWHLPSDAEWKTLTTFLGGEGMAGPKMRSTSGWLKNGNGTNESGFAALPGGSSNSQVDAVGINGRWWSSTEGNAKVAWTRGLYSMSTKVNRYPDSKTDGYSVRCIKD